MIFIGPSVVNVYINYEKKFAFVEFRTGVPHVLAGNENEHDRSGALILLFEPMRLVSGNIMYIDMISPGFAGCAI